MFTQIPCNSQYVGCDISISHFEHITTWLDLQDEIAGMKRFMLVKCLMKEACDMYIYCRYITKNGVRIYPKNGKVFRFWVDDEVETVQNID